jgi:hypothetical protein
MVRLPNKRKGGSTTPLIENEAYRELYKNFSLTVTEEMLRELEEIPHNEKINEKEYKYGLTTKNEIPFSELVPLTEEPVIPNTSTENLFTLLDLNKDSSYESLILKLNEEFNNGKFIYLI